jgi:uncharacterized DUF497 family protein
VLPVIAEYARMGCERAAVPARAGFNDQRLLSIADLEHSDIEERWLSVGCASDGMMLSVVYPWSEGDATTSKVRVTSAQIRL